MTGEGLWLEKGRNYPPLAWPQPLQTHSHQVYPSQLWTLLPVLGPWLLVGVVLSQAGSVLASPGV